MPLIPVATVTAEQLQARLNIADADEAERVLAVALAELQRATEAAWRPVTVATWDDWIIRVAGAVKGARKRPTGQQGQLTTIEQGQAVAQSRDYLAPVRSELAQYVDLGFA